MIPELIHVRGVDIERISHQLGRSKGKLISFSVDVGVHKIPHVEFRKLLLDIVYLFAGIYLCFGGNFGDLHGI
jgi:hypothetical protein